MSRKKVGNGEYRVQKYEDIENQYVKIYCTTNQILQLVFCDPHNKPHGAHGLGDH